MSVSATRTEGEETCYLLQFDGSAVPNPGKASGAAVLFAPLTREMIFEVGDYIPFATNNVAEYTGLIIGLEAALEGGVKRLIVEGDSMLVVKQVQGLWKVSAAPLKPYCEKAKGLLAKFENVIIRHVYREKNTHADALTNEVVSRCMGFRR
jgi:ribonuclease HI